MSIWENRSGFNKYKKPFKTMKAKTGFAGISYLEAVEKELAKGEKRQRSAAARYLARKMRQNLSTEDVSAPGDYPGLNTGNLRAGIKVRNLTYESMVGPVAPAYHAKLLEFGRKSGEKMSKKTGKKVIIHNMEPRPFMEPTFMEERKEVQKILSDPWI